MIKIAATPEELQRGKLDPDRQAAAVRALNEDGIVILEDVIDLDHIAILRERAFEDAQRLIERKDTPFNWNSGNLQQDPAPFPPYLFRDVLANDLVIEITHELMGNGVFNAFYSGNTALKSESRQPVHADIGHLWANMDVATPPYAVVVNVPLVDFSALNGSTEVWPGTHKDTSVSIQDGFIEVSEEKLAARRAEVPPVQPEVRAGGVVIRDIRLWHAGMPNHTDTPRPMIAMIHYVGWWHSDPIKLHSSAKELLEHPKLRQHATYLNDEIDHISTPHGYA